MDKRISGLLGGSAAVLLLSISYSLLKGTTVFNISPNGLTSASVNAFVLILIILGILIGLWCFAILLQQIKIAIGQLVGLGKGIDEINRAIKTLLAKKPEKVVLIILPVISQACILMLGKDFAPTNTKLFLSLCLILFVGMVVLIYKQEKKKWVGGLVLLVFVVMLLGLLALKFNINTWNDWTALIGQSWHAMMEQPIITMLTIVFIVGSLLLYILLGVFYGIRRKKSS